MNLLIQLLIGGFMIGLTVVIQAIGLDRIMRYAGTIEARIKSRKIAFWQCWFSAIVVIFISALHILNIWLWAMLYMILGCLSSRDLTTVLHFSTTNYTTVGGASLSLKPDFLMLDGIESMNGMIMLGWTTAFIFEFITKIYRKEAKPLAD